MNVATTTPVTFGYFGATIRLHPGLSLASIEWTQSQLEDESQPVAERLRRIVAGVIHPDDLEVFWQASLANRQWAADVADMLIRVLSAWAPSAMNRRQLRRLARRR